MTNNHIFLWSNYQWNLTVESNLQSFENYPENIWNQVNCVVQVCNKNTIRCFHSKEDVENAYIAAKSAFPIWSQTTLEERSRILIKISELLEANLQRFAEAESKDNGKPVSLAKSVDIPRAASNFRFFGNAITQFASESHESVGQQAINYTLRQPIGVVGCISP